jgi:hypothetical protein
MEGEEGPPRGRATTAALLAAGGALAAALGWWIAGPLAGLAAAGLYAGALAAWIAAQPRQALRAAAAEPLEAGAAPRLRNLAAGLAADLGVSVPSLWLVSGPGANALVSRAGGPALGVTRQLLETYTRTELEAVVAHCLVRLGASSLRREALAAALGPLGRPLCPVLGAPSDAAAAAVTRYPPALATAILKASPARRNAPFYFVAAPPWHEDPEARAALVADL